MERVRVYNEKGMPAKKGVGMFAKAFMEHFPLLPVEEEGRLHDPKLPDNFIERIFALARWREVLAKGVTRGNLVDFHTRHKLLILSHNPKHCQMMGQLVARAKTIPLRQLYDQYQSVYGSPPIEDHTEKERQCATAHDGLFQGTTFA